MSVMLVRPNGDMVLKARFDASQLPAEYQTPEGMAKLEQFIAAEMSRRMEEQMKTWAREMFVGK